MLSLEWENMKKVGYYTRLIILSACVRGKGECSLICLRSEEIYQSWAVCFWFLSLWDWPMPQWTSQNLCKFLLRPKNKYSGFFLKIMQLLIQWGEEKPNNFKVSFEFVSMNSWKRFAIKTCKFEKSVVKMDIWPAPVLTKCEFWVGVFVSSSDINKFQCFKMWNWAGL